MRCEMAIGADQNRVALKGFVIRLLDHAALGLVLLQGDRPDGSPCIIQMRDDPGVKSNVGNAKGIFFLHFPIAFYFISPTHRGSEG